MFIIKILPFRLIFFCLSLYFSCSKKCFSQDLIFSKYYFNSPAWNTIAYDMIVTSDNNYLIAGCAFRPSGDQYYSLIKVNENGDTVWFRTETQNALSSEAFVVRELSNGNYVVGANKNSPRDSLYLSFYDTSGVLLFQKSYGDTIDNHIGTIVEVNGFLYTFCQRIVNPQFLTTVVYKTDLNGDLVSQFLDTTFAIATESNSVILESNQFTITGFVTDSAFTGFEPVIIKIDTSFQHIWSNKYPINQFTNGLQITQTNDNGYAFTVINPNYLIKIDSFGNEQWRLPLMLSNPSLNSVGNKIMISSPEIRVYWYDVSGNPLDTSFIPINPYGANVDRTAVKGDTLVFIETVQSGSTPISSSSVLTLIRDSTIINNIFQERDIEIILYPNLIHSGEKIYVKGFKEKFLYSLYDIRGRKVLENWADSSFGSTTQLTLNNNLKGIYILKLVSNKQLLKYKVIIY